MKWLATWFDSFYKLFWKDTKTLICNFQMPQVDSQVIRTEIGFLVTVYAYTVYVVCVCIGKYSPRWCLDHQFHRLYSRYLNKFANERYIELVKV